MLILGKRVKRSFPMNQAFGSSQFTCGTEGPGQSRFEKPEIEIEKGACAYFGRQLKKIFPAPPESSAPEEIAILLRKIQALLGGSPAP